MYFINYEKGQRDSIPSTLQNDGWTKVFDFGKWHVIANEKREDQIKSYPLRDDLLITRNNIIMHIFGYFAVTHFMLFFVSTFIRLSFSVSL